MNDGRVNDWHSRVVNLWRDVETELERVNAFGRVPLHYRTVGYSESLERMEQRLTNLQVRSADGEWHRPLRALKVTAGSNWVLGLLESWALVGQVLSFYQERIANEGFIASAIEELSVRELLRMVGYRPFPGTAGSALSAFLASGATGMPAVVDIPKGARIQGVPLGGQLPQIFETTASLGGHAEWNRMSAYVPRIPVAPPLEGSDTTVDLAGYETSLKPGDPLLLELGDAPILRWVEKAKRKKGEALRLGSESGVPARKSLRGFDTPATEVTLTAELNPQQPGELKLEAAIRFAERGHLFGYNAPMWAQVPDTVRRCYAPIQGGVQVSDDDGTTWQSADGGLPELEIHSLATVGPRLFAGTSKGLYRRSDESLGSPSDELCAEGETQGWSVVTNGVGRLSITAITGLAGERSGEHVWIADNRGQVYQSSDGGESFAPVQGRVSPQVAGLGALLRNFAKKMTAPLHWSKKPTARPSLPTGPVYSLAALDVEGQTELFAGTEKGLFAFLLPAGGWLPKSHGLPGYDSKTGQASTAVRALLIWKKQRLLLGCDKGLFSSSDRGRRWRNVSRGLPKDTSISCLTGYDDGRRRHSMLFAGSESGVYRSSDPEHGWSSASLGLIDPAPDATGPPKVDALASRLSPVTLQHDVFAGTPNGLFRSPDGGDSWGQVSSLQPIQEIDAVTVDGLGNVLAAMPFAGFADDEWPGFHLQAGAIDLDKVYSRVVSGGWVLLVQPPSVGGITTAFFQIKKVSEIERNDFELEALVTRLEVIDDGTLSTFDLRTTRVFLSSVEIEPWKREVPDLRPVMGSQIRISPALKDVPENERRMIVTGQRARVRPRHGWNLPGKALTMAPPPDPSESLPAFSWRRLPDGSHLVGVIDRSGRRRHLKAGSLEWLPAEKDDEELGQAVNVVETTFATSAGPTSSPKPSSATDSPDGAESTSATNTATGSTAKSVAGSESGATSLDGDSEATSAADFTLLRLDESLEALFDPSTVSVWGNVAPSSQGETVSQAIGSGDAAKALQRFPLTRPITYLPAKTEDGYRSTLEIEVAGAIWREVPHLAEVDDPTAHVYMVRKDLAGRPLVIFGDGRNGARLPTGRNNVVATYRSGMWPEALAPHQLSILQTRPLGLRHSDNPLPSQAGAPAEDRGTSRQRLPWWQRPLGRAVTLRDYQDFINQSTYVALALVAPLVVRGRPLIQITVAAPEGAFLDPRGQAFQQLVGALDAQRSPGSPVRLQNYEPVRWVAGLRLQIEKHEDKAQVADAVRRQLEQRFSFRRAAYGQRLFVGQVVDAAIEVEGVMAAEATSFGTLESSGAAENGDGDSRYGSWLAEKQGRGDDGTLEPARNGRLKARLARVERSSGKIRPAQLLTLARVDLELHT